MESAWYAKNSKAFDLLQNGITPLTDLAFRLLMDDYYVCDKRKEIRIFMGNVIRSAKLKTELRNLHLRNLANLSDKVSATSTFSEGTIIPYC